MIDNNPELEKIDGLIDFLKIKKKFSDDHAQKYAYSEIISYLEEHKCYVELGRGAGYTVRENKNVG